MTRTSTKTIGKSRSLKTSKAKVGKKMIKRTVSKAKSKV